jgi:hypothetical protein
LRYTIKGDSLFKGIWYCPTIDTISLIHEEGQLNLFASSWNNSTIEDEECIILWNHEHGFLALYNIEDGNFLILEPSGVEQFPPMFLAYFRTKFLEK